MFNILSYLLMFIENDFICFVCYLFEFCVLFVQVFGNDFVCVFGSDFIWLWFLGMILFV